MRIRVTELQQGDRISSDIFNFYGLNILSKGTELNGQEIAKLLQHHVEYVDIEERTVHREEATAGWIQPQHVSPRWMPRVAPLYAEAVDGCKQLFLQAAEEGCVDRSAVSDSFHPLMSAFQMERDIVSILLLMNTNDAYTYQHSVQVGMLAHYIASWMGYDDEEADKIGTAGFLHDIGKCKIDSSILNKPGKLTAQEFEQVKLHTVYGAEIISASYEQELYSVAALQHHERTSGQGYPHRLAGAQIHPVARIVSVADVYSAMISSRIYQAKRDLMVVLKEMYRMSFGELDPVTTHTFIRHMIPNFIGKQVELQSGEQGRIIMTNPNDFFRPLIQVDEQFIDMTVTPELEIRHVFM